MVLTFEEKSASYPSAMTRATNERGDFIQRGWVAGALGILFCVVASGFASAWTIAPQKDESKKLDAGPGSAIVPVEALRFGKALQDAAPEKLKKWAEELAKGELRAKPVDPKGTMKWVDERYARFDETTRDAITYLVFFLAYEDEDKNFRTLGYRVRDIDRETKEITRELQTIWKNEQSRGASPMQAQSQQSRIEQEEYVQKQESRLRDFGDERQLKVTEMEASRKKVNTYLKLLELAHKRMRGTDPKILRQVKA